MSTSKPASVARRQQIAVGVLTPKQTPLMRALRDAMSHMVQGCKPRLSRRFVFDNAGYPDRMCVTDRLAIAVDDACDALLREPALGNVDRREQALAIPRTLEAHIRARFAPTPVQSLKEHGLRVSRTDAAEDMTLAEHLANPSDPSIALRAADMAEHEAREKLGFADQIRAFFTRHHSHRTGAA